MGIRNNRPAQEEDEQASSEVALITDRRLIEQFAEMASMIPAEDGNANETILRQILTATTWEDTGKPWDVSDLSDVLNKPLKLMRAKRRVSTYSGGLGMFLVLFLVDEKTGEEFVKPTGSISIVGQVARWYALNAMPMRVEWKRAETASENGYFPQHLKPLDSFGPGIEGGR
jgi:hypothetical protein